MRLHTAPRSTAFKTNPGKGIEKICDMVSSFFKRVDLYAVLLFDCKKQGEKSLWFGLVEGISVVCNYNNVCK